MTPSTESFGSLIRALRQEKGLKLRELAKKAGMSATYLSKIEADDFKPPSTDKMEALARELGVKPDELYAAAKRMPEDVKQLIADDPQKAMLLLRRAKDISVEDLEKFIEAKKRGNKKAD